MLYDMVGLRPSPTILMLSLYKMLMMDVQSYSPEIVQLKRLIYNSIYMDNGCITCNDLEYLSWAYHQLVIIFQQYQLKLQQFATNALSLQRKLDEGLEKPTPDGAKYFGMLWHRCEDKLSPYPIQLNEEANCKRSILSSLNGVYDVFGIYGPILNRSKIFFQRLQLDSFDWDEVLPEFLCKEWRNIVRQANTTPVVAIDRCVGDGTGLFDLLAFSDASADIYGVVVYIWEVSTNKVNFLLAKNKLINKSGLKKSIPSLECQGIALATESLAELYGELSGTDIVDPIKINKLIVYTDSMVNLHWLSSYQNNEKSQKRRFTYLIDWKESNTAVKSTLWNLCI